jgi:hypothetical protein
MASLDSLSWFLDAPARVLGERHRWVSFALGVAVQLCAGTLYSVSAWGVALRDAAGWENDEDLSLATTVGTLGVYLAVHNGLALDRFGARPCLAFASIALLLGWNLLARVASSNGSPAAAAFALALVGQGSVTSFLASLAPNVANFEEAHQGKAHGVLLAGFGGSSALFAAAYRGAFVGNLPGFFAFAGWLTALVAAANAFACKDGAREKRLSRVMSHGGLSHGSSYAFATRRSNAASGIRLARIGGRGGGDDADEDERRLVEPNAEDAAADGERRRSQMSSGTSKHSISGVDENENATEEEARDVGDEEAPRVKESRDDAKTPFESETTESSNLAAHLKKLFSTPLFWLLYSHLTLTLGTALLWVNQAGPFAVVADDSVNAKSASLATMVMLFSLGNVGGRVACGVASDFCETKFATPRAFFLIVGGLFMCLGSACLAGAPEREDTRNGVALTIGLAEGTIMAAWTSAVRNAFGEARFGLHLAVYNSALALGSSLFNGFAAAATSDPGDYGDGEVVGYKATFAIATTACGGATLLAMAIVKATRHDAAERAAAARRGNDVGG